MVQTGDIKYPLPRYRKLQVFAFDPSVNLDIETAVINKLDLDILWEDLGIGPTGEYLEVVDVDPPSNLFYPPVDLDDPCLLVQDGLPPSEGNPQFHQQMVYAVAMKTIQNFEFALGRKVLWSPHTDADGSEKFVKRLRIYPHALRQANAYYSPRKKALLFGYFPAASSDVGHNLPGGMVFTCLSHDIITHETTHALMDGIHPFFGEPSNPDALALHEAFADLVALFQRFSYPDVLRHEIARTRGDLEKRNFLAELARQFGEATGKRGALRSAIGDPADPSALQRTQEPHERGSILVAAVFEAFVTVYKVRIGDLLRIATGGTGVLQEGAIHPDLVDRLAEEAARISQHILNMCIHALDYCPPVDISFGEYLRALITADVDYNPADPYGYRVAFIESFRKRGIYPSHVRNLSEESLIWYQPEDDEVLSKIFDYHFQVALITRQVVVSRVQDRRETIYSIDGKTRADIKNRVLSALGLQALENNLPRYQKEDVQEPVRKRRTVSQEAAFEALERSLNMTLRLENQPKSIFTVKLRRIDTQEEVEIADFDVNSVRLAYRIDWSGRPRTDLVVEISQCRRGYLDAGTQQAVDCGDLDPGEHPQDFVFRGGATLLIDVDTGKVRYVMHKSVASNRRLGIQRRYLSEPESSLAYTYFGNAQSNYFRAGAVDREPFALLHGDDYMED
jgi:hypothetical protein